MKKKFLIFFVFFFLFINDAKAVQCGDIQKIVTDYKYYVQKETEACADTSTEENTITCNNSKLQKNLLVADLMKFKEENAICDEAMTDVDNIIDDNKDNCSRILDEGFNDFVNKVMLVFYILGPILLIVFGSIDYARATAEGSEESLRKANKNFGKRVFATVLLFLTPAITNFIISFNVSDYYLSGNAYSCNYSFTVFNDVRKIGMIQLQRDKKYNMGTANGGKKVGNYILFAQSDPAWASEPLIASSSKTIEQAGCAVTSVAMAIANSGVETIEPINPSSFSKILKNTGNYGCSCNCCIVWGGSSAATNGHLVLASDPYVTGNINNKAKQIAEYLDQGYHIVLQVKWGTDDSSHYVYVLYVENGNIMVGDAWNGELLNLNESNYPIASNSFNSEVYLYKVVD